MYGRILFAALGMLIVANVPLEPGVGFKSLVIVTSVVNSFMRYMVSIY